MNGQYQQPLDSLNNDNKYVGYKVWGRVCCHCGLCPWHLGKGTCSAAISQATDLSFLSEQSAFWWQHHCRGLMRVCLGAQHNEPAASGPVPLAIGRTGR